MPNIDVENGLQEISLYITKSSLSDGEMRWSAVNSDTDWDLYNERMSLELFKSMISKINRKQSPPDEFVDLITSDFWKGGMPYLSIAHFSDGNGKAVPGEVQKLYIDGTQLKAKGILYDNPLGRAVWKSLKEDEIQYKNDADADKIRISIAFIDLAHRHGDGEIFRRKSLTDRCQLCEKGIEEKTYVDGYLVHLALTRVPVNRRTIMELEDGMTKKSKPVTRKEDAESVLGGDAALAEMVAEAAVEAKSDAIVEMSEAEDTTSPVAEEVPSGDPPVESEPTVEAKSESFTPEQVSVISDIVSKAMKEMKKDEEADSAGKKEEGKDYPKKSGTVAEVQKSTLELSVDNLYNTINGAIGKSMTSDAKLQEIQPALEAVGAEILKVVKASTDEPAPAQPDSNTTILEEIRSLSLAVQNISTEVATMKAQNTVQPQSQRVPVPRSVIVKSDAPATPEIKPGSVKDIARRSVGLQ